MNSRQSRYVHGFCALLRTTTKGKNPTQPVIPTYNREKVLRLVLLLLHTRLQREYSTERKQDPAAAANQNHHDFFFFLAHLVLLCHSTSTVFSSPSMAAGGARKSEGGSVRNPCRRPEPQDNKVDPHARKNLWRLRNFFMVSRLMLVFPGPLSVFMPSSTGEYRCQALKRPGSSVVCVESRSHMPSSRG